MIEERLVRRQRAPGLDLRERDVLERKPVLHLSLELAQPCHQRHLEKLHPHRQVVDERSDRRLDSFQLGRPSRHHRAEGHVRAARDLCQENPPRPLKHDARGESMIARERAHRGNERLLEQKLLALGMTARAVALAGGDVRGHRRHAG